jgi:hypothetical protein
MPMNGEDQLGLGIFRGVPAIARAIGETDRRTYTLLQSGVLPAEREGRIWVTTRARLRRHYAGDSDAA